ncbi:MAG TPA: ABC transporter permease, partial [Syntrophorhabdaceae bacterium]|nr:ABC transporter permease [Syntrophorhabdaceae bacterium]
KKINFPRNIIPFALVMHDMLHFILAIPVIIAFLYSSGLNPHLSWFIGIPILIIAQFCLTYGLSLIIASINLFFRDLERLTVIFINILFYATPVFYSETMIPYKYQIFLKLNPLAPLIVNWRGLFLKGIILWDGVILSFSYGVLFLVMGLLVYKNLSWRFAEVL